MMATAANSTVRTGRWNSAASRPTSSLLTPTSMRRRMRRAQASSSMPARCAPAGRACWSTREVHVAFVERVAARADSLSIGDPFSSERHAGARHLRLAAAAHPRLHPERPAGKAQVVAGGERVGVRASSCSRPYSPTPTTGMSVAQEEIFGPVATVIPFRDDADAVRIANDSRYSLAAGVWTNDVKRAHRVSQACAVRCGSTRSARPIHACRGVDLAVTRVLAAISDGRRSTTTRSKKLCGCISARQLKPIQRAWCGLSLQRASSLWHARLRYAATPLTAQAVAASERGPSGRPDKKAERTAAPSSA